MTCIFIVIFQEGVTGYWVGVVCLAIGVACSLLVLVYICLTFRQQQALYGCIQITSEAPSKPPAPIMPPGPKAAVVHHQPKALPTPRPSTGGGLPSLGHFEGKKPNSAYTDSTRGVEWDPDTVLGDD